MSDKIYIVDNNKYTPYQQFYKATEGSAGYDICSSELALIPGGAVAKVATGVKIDMPSHVYLEIFSRSGLALSGITVANGVGIIDSDYKGELFILIRNNNQEPFYVKPGDRIAQGIFKEIKDFTLQHTDVFNYNMTKSARGSGGFGSTNIN